MQISKALHAASILACAGAVLFLNRATADPVKLPDQYFRLIDAELKVIEKRLVTGRAADPKALGAQARMLPGAVLAAAVLYAKPHPANRSHASRPMLELARKLGDLLAVESEQGRFQRILNSPWGTYLWLEAYRLLEHDLGTDSRQQWSKRLRADVQDVFDQMAPRADFPRYQSPYIRTSTNHFSLWASTVYLAGRVFGNPEWERSGAQVMHRLAAQEQTADGYWGELTDNGPATGYNALTLSGIGLYWEHSNDTAALQAIRRAAEFHMHFTWPDGTPVETINGRNRHGNVSPWAHFAFSHSPEGRGYAELLTGFFQEGKLGVADGGGVAQTLGRVAQNALYYHEGSGAAPPQTQPQYVRQMSVPAGIHKSGPWVVCLSGLIEPRVSNQFMLDRQGHLSIYHETPGLIVTGANSKRQPELATFVEKTRAETRFIPTSARLRMSDERDRLSLSYETFFAELEVRAPGGNALSLRFTVIETSPNRMEDVTLTLQLCLRAGEVLETARSRTVLGGDRIELGPEAIGGAIRHHGWRLRVDPSARLVWPVYPFNPYTNGPETDLRHAVGALSVPVRVRPPAGRNVSWRRQEIAFDVEVE
jgi:hypothetical protein